MMAEKSPKVQSKKISLCGGCTILGELPPEDPVCDSGIFCYGPLLRTIQMSSLYKDSKTFVDKKLKYPAGKIIKNFETLVNEQNGELLSLEQIKQFVEDNFEDEGLELESWSPDDWTPNPEFIAKLKKPQLRGLAKRINRLWKDLSRKIKDDVKDNPDLYSLIYVPNGFVVPGGRFREFYYWDTYWIVRALLHYDMTTTVKGIVENFLLMVSTYGMVPNGGRIYYTKRSQPPFLTLMMKEYVDKTDDVKFVRTHLATLEKEMEFWETRRSVTVQINDENDHHTMFVFGTGGTGPRPESYREDVESANHFKTEKERENFYFHMKAGAESGWDYSTRWMINEAGGNTCTEEDGLYYVKTNHIIPVDLNSLIYMNYVCISEFHSLLGDTVRSEVFMRKARAIKRAIKDVLWDEAEKMWFDYDLQNNRQRKYFYPSNLFPLWAESYDLNERKMVAESAVDYLRRTGASKCKGGIPTSFENSGQQWDYPNAWPPLQHILVSGLLKTENDEAKKMALTIARRYTVGAMFSCPDGSEVCNMFEKYNAEAIGSAGGGGEYDVQTGFGWTNGVVIDFMVKFGDDLLSDDEDDGGDLKEEQLNLHFDLKEGKSRPIKRQWSTIAKAMQGMGIRVPEKHELERSEKSLVHPALSIEEDDPRNPTKLSTGKHATKTLSTIYGDIMILDDDLSVKGDEKDEEDDAMSSSSGISSSSFSNSSVYNRERTERMLDEILEDENEDIFDDDIDESSVSCMDNIEEVKRINGKCITKSIDQNKQLVKHLGKNDFLSEDNTKLFNRNSVVRRSKSLPTRDAVSIPLSASKDVDVQLKDFNGKEIALNDLDLELHLSPQQLIASSIRQNDNVKYRVKDMLSRFTKTNCQKNTNSKSTIHSRDKSEDNVVYIKDRITLKDSVNGTEFDVEMDLKVEIEDPDQICRIQEVDCDDAIENSINKQTRRQRSKSCGRGVRHALTDRLCRPLFGGSTNRLDTKSSPKSEQSSSLNTSICAASCISAPWKRRLRRRQSKYQEAKKESLSRSKSLDLPRHKELERQKDITMKDDNSSLEVRKQVNVGQQVFQSALKEFGAINTSTGTSPQSESIKKVSKCQETETSTFIAKNISPKTHPNLTRVMSDNNIITTSSTKEKLSGSNPSLQLRRLYSKKNETGEKKTKYCENKKAADKKGIRGYSTNDLISFARHQPLLSQKSYETLSKSQSDLFRITAI